MSIVQYECAYFDFTNYFNDKIVLHLHRVYLVTKECANKPTLTIKLCNAMI
jgi:hypothetical protein